MSWYLLDTKDKPGLLWAFLKEFNNQGDLILEGNFKDRGVYRWPDAHEVKETSVARRQTRSPKHDFISLPINEVTTKLLKVELSKSGMFDWGSPFVHYQILVNETLVLLGGDHFHRECVSAFPPVTESFLAGMIDKGIIRGYETYT